METISYWSRMTTPSSWVSVCALASARRSYTALAVKILVQALKITAIVKTTASMVRVFFFVSVIKTSLSKMTRSVIESCKLYRKQRFLSMVLIKT